MTSAPTPSRPDPSAHSHNGAPLAPEEYPVSPSSIYDDLERPSDKSGDASLHQDVYARRFSAQTSPTPKDKKGRRGILVLATALAVAIAGSGYLAYLANEWSGFATATHSANFELGAGLRNTELELDSAKQSLANTRDQLTTAQQRISELAKEKALVGDDREQQRIIAQDTTAVATESLAVSRDLARCVDLQVEYTGYLNDYAAAQNKVASQSSLAEQDRDSSVLNTAVSAASEAVEAMKGLEDNLNDVCSASVERHNKLIEDLRE